MKHLITTILVLAVSSASLLLGQVIPRPESMEMGKGELTLSKTISYSLQGGPAMQSVMGLFLDSLKKQTGISLVKAGQNATLAVSIKPAPPGQNKEAYTLQITSKGIQLEASSANGLFYGTQTLLQLLPAKIGNASLPCCKITDQPRFGMRGLMLDSGRHYQSVGFIKRLLTVMARMKMNTFHWHLTESDGWRIEIKKYPELTEIGSNLTAGGYPEQKGFYTQKEIRDIVAYAAERHITVIPEIDVPGHSYAALLAKPEFTCPGTVPNEKDLKANNIPARGRGAITFCPSKPQVRQFLKDVFSEVCELFPSTYIHVGGDEVNHSAWEKCPSCKAYKAKHKIANSHDLQIDFANFLAEFLETKGRKTIIWSDLYVPKGKKFHRNITVDWWNPRRNKEKAITKAAKENRPFIASPNTYTYLNFPVTPWRGYKKDRTFGLKTTYLSNTIDPALAKLNTNKSDLCQGVICALWTDFGLTEEMLPSRLFPRVLAISEIAWHRGEKTDYDDFKALTEQQKEHFEGLGFPYGPAELSDNHPKKNKNANN